MKLSLQDKVAFVLAALWVWFWGFIMLVEGYGEMTLRQLGVMIVVPLVMFWFTGTLAKILEQFKKE